MKILVVMRGLPGLDWGASIRTHHLLQALQREHSVSVAALSARTVVNQPREPVRLACAVHRVEDGSAQRKRIRQVQAVLTGHSYILSQHNGRRARAMLGTLMEDTRYDAVFFESVLVANSTPPKGTKVIIDQHNIEHEILWRAYQQESVPIRRWYSRLEYGALRTGELARCRGADLLLVTSERERQIFSRLVPEVPLAVVPNGVDLSRFPPVPEQDVVEGRVVFTGAMDYRPNVHGALLFGRHCWPRIHQHVPHATWHIVGSNPPKELRELATLPGVTVTGTVPSVQPYLAAASVAIAPLRIGSGTRLKILEAFASQKAVVSTSLGCEGLDVVPGTHLLVADQLDLFADEIISLLHQPAKRQSLAAAGHALAVQQYSWRSCGERLLQVLRSTL